MGVEHASPAMLLILASLGGLLFYYIRKASVQDFYVRKIAGIEAIDTAICRAVEMGRPMSFSTGLTVVSPVLYAVLGVFYYVAKKSAIFSVKLIVPQVNPEVIAIVEEVYKDAFSDAGKFDNFDPTNIVYLSDSQFAFASGYQGLIHRENVGSAFLMGFFAAESLIMAEAGQQIDAMQVAGSISPEQVPFFITACDYTLIGEEIFAASAYLTHEPIQMGSLYAGDKAKIALFVIILLGVVSATLDSLFGYQLIDINAIIRADWGVLAGW